MKRIFRWTVGDVSSQGIDILKESIKQTKKNLKNLNFEFYICCNSDESKIGKICLETNVQLIVQNWEKDFPLPNIIPEEYDIGSKCGIPKGRQGSFWKICPPRIDINSYEIIADNDVIINKLPIEIEEFLSQKKVLVCEDNLMAFGKYTKFIKPKKPYNSGLFGVYPGFDFKNNLIKKWEDTNRMCPLMSRDEQGLIIATLLDSDFIEISKEKTCFVFHEGEGSKSYYEYFLENNFETQKIIGIDFKKCKLEKEILHFLGANRQNYHYYWNLYKRNKNKLL